MIQTHHWSNQQTEDPSSCIFSFTNHNSNLKARKKMIIKLIVDFLLKTTYTKPEQIREMGGLYKYQLLLHTISAQTYNPRT